jgi:hypothetical protein
MQNETKEKGLLYYLFVSIIQFCCSWHLSEKDHFCYKWKSVMSGHIKTCAEHITRLLEEIESKETK